MAESAQTDQPIIWQPTPKQSEFLSASEDEILYGGAAGGGKSDSLVIDALGLQQEAIRKSNYRGILFRRSFPELRELIDRSREIYPAIIPGADYHESAKEWRFPSGSKIEMGYLESEADRFRYQGRQYQYIGWDELTQWASEAGYSYLQSRLRSPDPTIKCYTRSTCNPGGVGHEWVREYWRIEDHGGPTRFSVTAGDRVITRRFIPARLDDNPYLSGTDYRSRLMLMSEMERRALLDGRWDVVDIAGAIYKQEIIAAYAENRVRELPIEPAIPVNTFWDLGMNDTTVIWFHQRVGPENRFIDYYETNGEGLSHYIRVLQQKNYVYGTHYLPHDVEVTELTSGKSRYDTLYQAGVRPIHVVPRTNDVMEGIEIMRQLFPTCWFDKQRCKQGLKALAAYRREWDERQQVFKPRPLHDWASNGSDGVRMFAEGYMPPRTTTSKRRRSGSWRSV